MERCRRSVRNAPLFCIFKMNLPRVDNRRLCLRAAVLLLSGVLFVGGVCAGEEEEEVKSGFSFAIGTRNEAGTVAQVVVQEVAPAEGRRGLLKMMKPAPLVFRGVAVRFEQVEAEALDEIPAVLKAFGKNPAFQLRRLSFYAPGDPVPRLIADEALTNVRGEWVLRRVLMADRPSAAECKLVWGKGPPRLAFAKGNSLAFSELLGPREVR